MRYVVFKLFCWVFLRKILINLKRLIPCTCAFSAFLFGDFYCLNNYKGNNIRQTKAIAIIRRISTNWENIFCKGNNSISYPNDLNQNTKTSANISNSLGLSQENTICSMFLLSRALPTLETSGTNKSLSGKFSIYSIIPGVYTSGGYKIRSKHF